MTPEDCIKARRLLGWSQAHLAAAARTSSKLIDRFEREGAVPEVARRQDWRQLVRAALERAGIEFVDQNEGGPEKKTSEYSALTYAQCIEARRLLGLRLVDLAKATGLSHSLISGFECGGRIPRARNGSDRMALLRGFFENAGLEFTYGDEPGVQLRKTDP